MLTLFTPSMRMVRLLAVLLVAAAAAGCAATPARTTSHDPYENFNRKVDKFNDTLDRAALKPVAKAYKKVTPRVVRSGVSNFFANLEYPTTIINQFLQGKFSLGFRDTGRLLVNTTLGIGGLFDVATKMNLPANDEDFGQTLAVWGVPAGPYLVLPFFGPSNFRDGPSRIPDFYTDGTHYLDIKEWERWALRGVEVVNDRAELLSAEQTLNTAYDRYAFLRDVWVQRREYLIFDGNPPQEDLEDILDDEPLDDPMAIEPEMENEVPVTSGSSGAGPDTTAEDPQPGQ
jgi:phospholipid-binding lipoprotein MlaA